MFLFGEHSAIFELIIDGLCPVSRVQISYRLPDRGNRQLVCHQQKGRLSNQANWPCDD